MACVFMIFTGLAVNKAKILLNLYSDYPGAPCSTEATRTLALDIKTEILVPPKRPPALTFAKRSKIGSHLCVKHQLALPFFKAQSPVDIQAHQGMSTPNAEATQYLNDILSDLDNTSEPGRDWRESADLATSVINEMQGNTPPLALGENDLVTFGNIQTIILGNIPDIIATTNEVRGDCVSESRSTKSELMILENTQNICVRISRRHLPFSLVPCLSCIDFLRRLLNNLTNAVVSAAPPDMSSETMNLMITMQSNINSALNLPTTSLPTEAPNSSITLSISSTNAIQFQVSPVFPISGGISAIQIGA
ncbi:hypothetical protein Clacol_005914 [Clathrus columnatus]|uniref:Uncharacterized protein n=1 Tax=Clathrus columnatus TaxID=1419009 RepID=A0AAV5AEW4_9AGAM|nr:hypothetical protein Clacol_005914 [Clathrus columnatus]